MPRIAHGLLAYGLPKSCEPNYIKGQQLLTRCSQLVHLVVFLVLLLLEHMTVPPVRPLGSPGSPRAVSPALRDPEPLLPPWREPPREHPAPQTQRENKKNRVWLTWFLAPCLIQHSKEPNNNNQEQQKRKRKKSVLDGRPRQHTGSLTCKSAASQPLLSLLAAAKRRPPLKVGPKLRCANTRNCYAPPATLASHWNSGPVL
jgi:hypothetical protein